MRRRTPPRVSPPSPLPGDHGTVTPRQRRRRARQRGVALLMVLAAVALLFVMAQQTRDEVEVYSLGANVARDQLIAEYQAKSAVNLTRVLLHAEPTIRRAIAPVLVPMMAMMGRGLAMPPQIPIWEQADLLLGAFRNRAAGNQLGELAHVDIGSARNMGGLTGLEPVVIVDEDSKININTVVRSNVAEFMVGQQLRGLMANTALNPYFENRDPDGQFTDRQTLIANVIDYIDFDDIGFDGASLFQTSASASSTGPEDTFYQTLHPPYRRRNAPLDSIEELRMVRGLGNDDLWSAVIDPDPGNPRRRTVTVWGQGAVNVNTANAQTILAHICSSAPDAPQCNDPTQVSSFISGITMMQAFTLSMGVPVFSTAQDFVATIQGRSQMGQMMTSMLHIQPFTIRDPAALTRNTTVESKIFSVYAEATVGQAHVRLHVVVDMRPQPALPSTYLRATGVQLAATGTGALGVVSSQGGTIIYWRED